MLRADASFYLEETQILIENGSNYNDADNYGNSCLDYASKFSWRTEFLEFVKEFENENR